MGLWRGNSGTDRFIRFLVRARIGDGCLADTRDHDHAVNDLAEPVDVAAQKHKQQRRLEVIELGVEGGFGERILPPVVDDCRVVAHAQHGVQDRHDHKRYVLRVLEPEVDADLSNVERDVDKVVEKHHADADNLHIEHHTKGDHGQRDKVVADESDAVAVGPQVRHIDKVVRCEQHVIHLLEPGHGANRRLFEFLAAVKCVEDAMPVRPAAERDTSQNCGDNIVDHVKCAVDELQRVLRLDEACHLLQDKRCHQHAVHCVCGKDAKEDRNIIPVKHSDLMEEMHKNEVMCDHLNAP